MENEEEVELYVEQYGDDPWQMPLHDRWRLYRYLAERRAPKEEERQKKSVEEYKESNQRYQQYRKLVDVALLKRAKVGLPEKI